MRYHELVEDLLTEMVVRTRHDLPAEIIAYKDSIWLLPVGGIDDIDGSEKDDIVARTGVDPEDHLSVQLDDRPDILHGRIDGRTLFVFRHEFQNLTSSLTIKKVMRQLGLTAVEAEHMGADENEHTERAGREEVIGRIPDIVFHGTNIKALRSILRSGLRPDTSNRNWRHLKFPYVFLTAKFSEAVFHANRQAAKDGETGNHPVVIALRIPDRAQIKLDYDVAQNFETDTDKLRALGYDKREDIQFIRRRAMKMNSKSDMSRESGIFAYGGRIPPSFFAGFIVGPKSDSYDEDPQFLVPLIHDNISITDKDDLLIAIDMFAEFGFYDPNYNPSDYDEDEFDDEDDR